MRCLRVAGVLSGHILAKIGQTAVSSTSESPAPLWQNDLMHSDQDWSPLSASEVAAAVEGRCPPRIPLVRAKWWGEGFEEKHQSELTRFDRYPDDVVELIMPNPVNPRRMKLSWEWRDEGPYDSRPVLPDWGLLDEFIDALPEPAEDPTWELLERQAERAHRQGRYALWGFANLFFERPWIIRGMQNLMVDYFEEPEAVLRLHEAMTDIYLRAIAEAKRRLSPHGFFTTDDLGHQTGPMISPHVFRRFLYPFYERVCAATHDSGMHLWLHSCGDNTLLLGDLIDSGVDVFHPVQKHTMDERLIAERYGGRVCFLVGIDVQHILIERKPEEVRCEVRHLVDTFGRIEGRLCLGAGNGILPGTPLDNIDAFLEAALRYGSLGS